MNEFSLSSRELRQIRRNLKKENETVSPFHNVLSDTDQESDISDIELSIEYSTKENTRRVKRSHEKKDRKRKMIDTSSDEEYVPYVPPIKKDNTRNGRRKAAAEALEKPSSNKHVTFEVEREPKTFRTPMGRYTKNLPKKKLPDEDMQKQRSSTRIRNLARTYYNTDFVYDDDDEEDEELNSFLYHTFVKI